MHKPLLSRWLHKEMGGAGRITCLATRKTNLVPWALILLHDMLFPKKTGRDKLSVHIRRQVLRKMLSRITHQGWRDREKVDKKRTRFSVSVLTTRSAAFLLAKFRKSPKMSDSRQNYRATQQPPPNVPCLLLIHKFAHLRQWKYPSDEKHFSLVGCQELEGMPAANVHRLM